MSFKFKFKMLNNDYVLNVICKVLNLLIGFVTSMFCARYLGVVNKGAYSYISQVANTCVIVFNLGVYQSYSFNYKKHVKETLKKYSDICFLQFVVYSAIALLIIAFSKDMKLVLAAALVPFNLLKSQYENIVLIERMRFRMLIHVVDKIILTACYGVLYFTAESNVIYIVVVTVFIDVFTVLVYLFRLGYFPKIWQVDFKFFKEVLKFGWLPMISLLLVTVNYSVDIFFLEHMGTAVELGYYSFAANIINYVWMLPDAFKEVLFSKSAKKLDRKNISISIQISLLSIGCCFAGFAVLGKFLISVVYGSEYVPSYEVVLILIIGAFPMSMFKLLGIVLVSQGKRVMHFTSLAISAAVNIVANIVAIPRWGMMGAACASVLSYSVCACVLIPYFCKLFGFSLKDLFVPSREFFDTVKKCFKRNTSKS